jgi:protein-S-isoprenylcysteine O-methyltransferase Ste14
MLEAYILVLGICLVSLGVRAIYEQLKKKGKIRTDGQAAVRVVFIAMSFFITSWVFLGFLDPVHAWDSIAAKCVGAFLLICGLGLVASGLITLKGVENIDHLVTTGIYRAFRHPMYVGFLFWISGWIVFHGAVVSTAPALLGMVNILYWRHLEEEALLAKYGEAFKKYRATTWF